MKGAVVLRGLIAGIAGLILWFAIPNAAYAQGDPCVKQADGTLVCTGTGGSAPAVGQQAAPLPTVAPVYATPAPAPAQQIIIAPPTPQEQYRGGYEWARDVGEAVGTAIGEADDQWVKAAQIKTDYLEAGVEVVVDTVNKVGTATAEVAVGLYEGVSSDTPNRLGGRKGRYEQSTLMACYDTAGRYLGDQWVAPGMVMHNAPQGSSSCPVQ